MAAMWYVYVFCYVYVFGVDVLKDEQVHALVSAAASPATPHCPALFSCYLPLLPHHPCQTLVSLSSFFFSSSSDAIELASIASSCSPPSSSLRVTGSLFQQTLPCPFPGQKTS